MGAQGISLTFCGFHHHQKDEGDGSAFYSLDQFVKAAEAYKKGLQFDPTNVQMKESLEDVRKKFASDSFGPGAGFNNLFNHPNLFAKLQTDPRIKPYLNDPSFVQILNNLQRNPDSIKRSQNFDHFELTLSVLLEIDMMPGGDAIDVDSPDPPPEPEPSPKKEGKPDINENLTDDEIKAREERELGNAVYEKKYFQIAVIHYNEAIELDPKNMSYYTNKAAVYFEQKEYHKCIEQCEKVIEVG
ncbi:hypothetical protein V9T40_006800 [Parthenolecanium corni]|uniref:STI1/HOP DP domain-containing protein n=1 Tax=Parthenolecanium corni TaxID=536013 RepID=A0AAN9Y8B8_9HEMI